MESGRGVDERDAEGDLGGGSEEVGGLVVLVVVEVVQVVGGIGANLSSSSDVMAGFGMRSYSYPVVTVPPCEGVWASLLQPA